MEHFLEPSATPEQLKEHFENCKVVLEHKVSYYYDGGKGLKNKVTTWASKCSRGQIEANGTASDKAKLGPPGNQNQKRKELFNRKGTIKENARFKKRQDRRKARKLDSNSSPSSSSDDSSPSAPSSARKLDALR